MPHVGWEGLNHFVHGSLDHAIEDGQVKASHMAFNVQHKYHLQQGGNHVALKGNIGLSPG